MRSRSRSRGRRRHRRSRSRSTRRRYRRSSHSRSGRRDRERERRRDRRSSRSRSRRGRRHRRERERRAVRESRSRSAKKRRVSESREEHPGSEYESGDEKGRVRFEVGDVIYDDERPTAGTNNKLKILNIAGVGTFGTVLACQDQMRQKKVAVKVVRSVRRYLDASYVEIDILKKVNELDPNRNSLCVHLMDFFVTHIRRRKHVCLVFESLGRSLYDFLKKNQYRGFSMEQVRHFGYQLLHSIKYLHSIKLIHTDLKPENILLEDDSFDLHERDDRKDHRVPKSSVIRLIDFGGATFQDDHHARMINTRQYRAPEVILGLPWSFPSDLWSIGCIMAELYTGELLFQTHNDLEHLALMRKILGRSVPDEMVDSALTPYRSDEPPPESRKRHRGRSSSCPRVDELFSLSTSKLRWPDKSPSAESVKHVDQTKTLEDLLPDENLVDLIHHLLQYEPDKRISPAEALEHPFFDSIRSAPDYPLPKPVEAHTNGKTVASEESVTPVSS